MDSEPRNETANSKTGTATLVWQYLHRYWGILVLLVWGSTLLALNLVRLDPYGIEEAAARGLILMWAIGDRVLNPLVTLGIPDFRILLFLPLGFYWPGSIVAAKVFTMLLAFAAVTLLYRWCRRTMDSETAQIACALLLIFPLFLNQIDAIGVGIYLLLMFTVAEWLDRRYRKIQRPLGGWFFMQLLWTAIAITIHPMGLAYPLALAWHWNKSPLDRRQQTYMYVGLALVVVVVLGIRGGWEHATWLGNPLLPLAQAYQAVAHVTGEPNWLVATLFAITAGALLLFDRRFLLNDFLGSVLLGAILLGLLAADGAWALLVVTLVFTRGTYYLIRINNAWRGHSLLRKRGLVLATVFIIATTAMLSDKARYLAIRENQLSQQDLLIRALAQDAADNDLVLSVASQWPGRTMLATRQDTFPLPPAAGKDSEAFLASIKNITHLIFDPGDPANKALAQQLANLTHRTKTVLLNSGGVVIAVFEPEGSEDKEAAPPGDTGGGS